MRRRAVASFADKVAVKKLLIFQLENSDMRLIEEIAESIKKEIGRHAITNEISSG